MGARVRKIGLMALAVVVGMVSVACGDDDATEEESVVTTEAGEAAPGSTAPEVAPTTSTSIATTSSTTEPSVAAGGASTWPWHAPGSAHTEPADAVAEFAEFVGFAEGFTLGDFLEGDARSGEIEIRSVGADSLGPPETLGNPDWLAWSPTTAFVRLDADDHWAVIGAASDAIVVDEPTPGSPLMKFTHKVASDGVWMQIWPDGSGEVLLEEVPVTSGGGVFTVDEWRVQPRIPPGATGPATVIFESRDGGIRGDVETIAVTTVRIDLTS